MRDRITTQRRRYSMGDSLLPFAEGNIGALKVLADLAQKMPGIEFLGFTLELDDMNIRGAQIWVAYKDVCGSNLDELIRRVNDRDPALADAINAVIPDGERAVAHGASFTHR